MAPANVGPGERRATFRSYSGWTWLMWPQPGEELERVMGIEPT
jgi:hypothetical protein